MCSTEAARRGTAEYAPIILAAGITVAAGAAALVAAELELFRSFGPGMALTILIGLAVSITLIPALLAILGPWVYRPSRPGPPDAGEPAEADGAGHQPGGRLVRALTTPKVARVVVVVGCALLLAAAALAVTRLGLGMAIVDSLPSDNPTSRAAAGVFGPNEQLTPLAAGVVLSRSGDAARYLIVLDEEPLGASAIARLRALDERMPALLKAAGLSLTQFSFAGDTALAEGVVERTEQDLGRIALAARGRGDPRPQLRHAGAGAAQALREFAFAMFVGILLDAFLVRSFLVPGLVSLVGRYSGWPGRQLRHTPAE